MTARCDLSDLPVDMCACRVHGPKDEPQGSGVDRVGIAFTAQYEGQCVDCRRPIVEGDRIQRADEDGEHAGYVHEECP